MKVHEWSKMEPGKRTSCGQLAVEGKRLSAVPDLSKILASAQCKNCMHTRDANGMSSTRGHEFDQVTRVMGDIFGLSSAEKGATKFVRDAVGHLTATQRLGVLAHAFRDAVLELHPEAVQALVDSDGRVWVKPIEAVAGVKRRKAGGA